MTRVLVVDDNLQNRRLMERKLKQWGVPFVMAKNGDEAIRAAKQESYPLILMDINLPQTEDDDPIDYLGIELAEEILRSVNSPKPTIVAITAHGMDVQRRAILKSGISSIIQKGREDYYQRVFECLEAKGLLDTKVRPPISHNSYSSQENSVSPSATTVACEIQSTSESHLRPQNSTEKPHSDTKPTDSVFGISTITIELEKLLLEVREFEKQIPCDSSCCEFCQSICACLEETLLELEKPPSAKRDSNFGHWFTNRVVAMPADLAELKLAAAGELMHTPRQIDEWIFSLNSILSRVHQVSGRSTVSSQISMPPDPQLVHSDVDSIDGSTTAVLIVDDESAAREDLVRKTRKLGYLAIPCESGATALELMQRMSFDICLVDMAMPSMDGLTFIREVKKRTELRHIPIVVVSGSCSDETGSQAIEAGAADYLSKPAQIEVLKARICYCLRSSEQRRQELSKFLPSHIAHSLLKNDSVLTKPKFCDISVMVCDIRGFSKICETRHPGDTIRWISDVMNSLSESILKSGGTIVDYVGDEIMAMWGAPVESDNHPEIAASCALEIQEEVERLSEKWRPELQASLAVGIGIHSGLAVCGNTGSQRRVKYGPLGNTVNLASRVQGTTKYLRSSILVTNDTRNRIKKTCISRRVCRIRVSNLKEPVELFELLDPRVRTEKLEFFRLYEEVLSKFESSDGDEEIIQQTVARAAQLLAENPNDGPARLLMSRILQVSLGNPFDPVWTMIGK